MNALARCVLLSPLQIMIKINLSCILGRLQGLRCQLCQIILSLGLITMLLCPLSLLTKELNACTDNIKTWMTENQLKLNDDKTEALLFPFSSSLKPSTCPLPHSITLGSHNIPFSDSARNLGFILNSKLSMKKHIIKVCQTAYFELKRISSIRRFLTEDATKTLVTSYILSRLDYCNCLFIF